MRKLLVLGFVVGAGACGKSTNHEPPPAPPPTGAPIAFVAKSFKTGGDRGGSVDVRAYNFSDKKVAQYWLLFRYTDATGNVLKVKPGTPFEKDHDFMTLSGKRFACAPRSWCGFKIDNLDVPANTAQIEVLAKSVTALKDGTAFEDEPLFELDTMEWPGDPPAAPAAPETPAADGSAGSAAEPGSAAP